MKISQKRKKEILNNLGGEVRSNGIFNGHNLCQRFNPAEVKVYLWYRPQQTGRGYQCAAWQVIRPGHKTDPEGHWRDYGHKTFNCFTPSADKQPQLEAAIKWANDHYGETEWVKDPFGNYQTKATIEAMDAAIQKHLEEA